MPLDKETIRERLSKLTDVVKLLEEYKKVPREDFLVDFTINSAAQFNLILGIEIIVDIGNHILSEKYQAHPKEYHEVITLLGEYHVVPLDFAREHSDMARFRNRIIHQYTEIDMKQVYNHLQKAPDVFSQFAQYYESLLEKEEI